MLRLPEIFSDKALYQHSSALTLSGDAAPGSTVSCILASDTVGWDSSFFTVARADGSFSLTFPTPEASFSTYTLTVSDGEDTRVLRDLLFGEVWLAFGQSNMELSNRTHNDCERVLDRLPDKYIRTFFVKLLDCADDHPAEPQRFYNGGVWADSDDIEVWRSASALATGFALDIFAHLNLCGDVPVGFISAGRGGAPLDIFLSRQMCENNPAVNKYLKRYGMDFDTHVWNSSGSGNYSQPSSGYNYIIHPLLGMKFRGLLWYQGETNSGREIEYPHYKEQLKYLRECYAELFSSSKDDLFPIISCQIAPWPYAHSGGCQIAYVNHAFESLHAADPEHFPCVPTCNLGMGWDFSENMHPIHPTNKYELAHSVSRVARNLVYSYGRVKQKVPAYATRIKRCEGYIQVKFKSVGTGLYIDGKTPRGLYIRSRSGAYTPAECVITDRNTLAVYHPDVENPWHVSYGISDFEHNLNLYAGDFPLLPFSSEIGEGRPMPEIQVKNWLNFELDSEAVVDYMTDEHQECFPEPIFYPLAGSSLCFDRDFYPDGRALRVKGDFDKKGFYILSHKFRELDLENYKALTMSLAHVKDLSDVRLTVYYEGGRAEELFARQCASQPLSRGEYRFDLSSLPKERATRVDFVFSHQRDGAHNRYVVVEGIRLSPASEKKSARPRVFAKNGKSAATALKNN